MGWNELCADVQRDRNPLRGSDDRRLGAEGGEPERVRRARKRLRRSGKRLLRNLRQAKALTNQFDNIAKTGNVVQCGEVGNIGTDATLTVALGYGSDAASAVAAADGSLAAGFADRERAFRGVSPYSGGWNGYVNALRAAPASVSSDTLRRRAYYVAAMILHAAEDKTFSGASVAGFGTPWGDFTNGDNLNDGYHRVWGRDLYQQATGLIAAGDAAQALRMARFMWTKQFISASTPQTGPHISPARSRATAPSADHRGDIAGARLLRAVGSGGLCDTARLDDGPHRQPHLPED